MGFARMIVRHRVSTLIDERAARCRDYHACLFSIDQPRDSQNLNSRDTVNSCLTDLRTGSVLGEKQTLRLDVERILMRLPAALATICRLLMICETNSEVAAKAGMSRATLYRQIQQVRKAFAQAGMDRLRKGRQ
jgi:DNA-directed RNA polymerase specialized sigma24 family protein